MIIGSINTTIRRKRLKIKLMQKDIYNILKNTSEYKLFKKKSKVRSIIALLIIAAFWVIIVLATDFNNIDDVSMIYFGLLILATIFSLRRAYRAFLKKPVIIAQGEIIDIREKKRTVNEEDKLQTRVSFRYLVHTDDNDYWGDCIYDFTDGRGKKHNVGEHVLFFSMSPGNNYIIKSDVQDRV